MSKEEVKKIISSRLSEIKSEYHVEKIGIFGSVVRGDENSESDIDILVELNSPLGFFEFIRLEDSLSDMLGGKVDLVSNKALKKQIKEEILREVEYV